MDLGYLRVVKSGVRATRLNRSGITEADRVERDKCSLFYSDVKFC